MAAASDQSESDSLLLSSLSKRNVLVVGDGNFSFSLSIGAFSLQCGLSTPLVLTSFDSREKLKQDEIASSNLNELERFKNVNVLHEVDATNLSQYFPNQKFGRIIFNFPHTGGKSNIKKCRKLLEDFFRSAVECLDSCGGDICVTLCKGQGGTPMDQPCRSHGNTWQIVDNAAKSGLILHKIYPFVSSDYAYYKSVGYRNRLIKGFHTSGGLIHIFIPGVKIDLAEDLSDKTANIILANIYEHVTHLMTQAQSVCKKDGPLRFLKQEIQDNLASLTDQLQTSFEEIDDISAEDCKNTHETDCDESVAASRQHIMQNTTIQNQKILSALKNHASFVLCDTALTIPKEITHTSHIVKNELIIGRLLGKTEECDSLKADSEIQVVLESLKTLFCASNDCEHGHVMKNSVDKVVDKTDSEIPTWTNSSQVAHLARRKSPLKSEPNVGESHTSTRRQVLCNCQTLSQRYLSKDTRLAHQQLAFLQLILPETLQVFEILSTVVVVTGRLSSKVLGKSGIDQNRHAWLIKVDLGALAMIRYQISDIRLLWSSYVTMERQGTVTSKVDDKIVETFQFIPKPLSLFPPSYIHDISFWISDDVSQDLFILAVISLTNNCVKEIKLTEIYHDEEKHRLSFNYRMIYSRPDGPLSHLEAVEFQNKLRTAMLVLKFGLK